MAKKLDGDALGATTSLAKALEDDNGELIRIRLNKLRGMLGKDLGAYRDQVFNRLTQTQRERLQRMSDL